MDEARVARLVFLAAAAAGAAGGLHGQMPSDQLAIFGTGKVGAWTAELTLSNPADAALTVDVKSTPGEIVCVQPCDFTHVIPARGTIVLPPPPPASVGVTYVGAFSDQPPRVLARVLDARGRSVDLPVFRLGDLLALDASELAFPGAQRWAEGTVNLLLANLWDSTHAPERVSLRLEAFDANGASRGVRDLDLANGEVRFLTDVLGFVGVANVEVGQLSVRRVGGTGKFWGTLSIVRTDGSLSVSVGASP
jgi:hypothetical protein